MSDILLQIGGTKLVLSAVLACAAWIVHRRFRLPGVSYPMWLLVPAALLVPAFMPAPVLPAAAAVDGLALPPAGSAEGAGGLGSDWTALGSALDATGKQILVMVWLLGTAALLGWSLWRAVRFRRTLMQALEPAPAELQRQAARISRRLGLARIPEIHTTHARISPMVWWTGGGVRVLLPTFLLAELTEEEARSILAHELVHVRRRDFLVRWLEWAACSVFWWNPAAWWASRELRAAEEACCDALVPGVAESSPKSYASALLRVVEVASKSPMLRAPVLASAASGAGQTRSLERRLKMIIEKSTPTTPRWLRTAAWIAAICTLPLGIVYCSRPDTPAALDEEAAEVLDAQADAAARAGDAGDESRDRGMERLNQLGRELRVQVEAGEITEEQARQRMTRARARMAQVEAVRREAAGGEAAGDRATERARTERLDQLGRELRVQVEAGKITEEQARQRMTRARARMAETRGERGNR